MTAHAPLQLAVGASFTPRVIPHPPKGHEAQALLRDRSRVKNTVSPQSRACAMDERGGGGGLTSPQSGPSTAYPNGDIYTKVQTVGVNGARQTNASGQSKPTARSEPEIRAHHPYPDQNAGLSQRAKPPKAARPSQLTGCHPDPSNTPAPSLPPQTQGRCGPLMPWDVRGRGLSWGG